MFEYCNDQCNYQCTADGYDQLFTGYILRDGYSCSDTIGDIGRQL